MKKWNLPAMYKRHRPARTRKTAVITMITIERESITRIGTIIY